MKEKIRNNERKKERKKEENKERWKDALMFRHLFFLSEGCK